MTGRAGFCHGCGEPIIDPTDIAAGQHLVEGPPVTRAVWRLDMDENLVESREPADPRYPCGPVEPVTDQAAQP